MLALILKSMTLDLLHAEILRPLTVQTRAHLLTGCQTVQLASLKLMLALPHKSMMALVHAETKSNLTAQEPKSTWLNTPKEQFSRNAWCLPLLAQPHLFTMALMLAGLRHLLIVTTQPTSG